jgi:hypothetical protein
MRCSLLSGFFVLVLPLVSQAADTDVEDLQRMIERLEQRIERLEAHSGIAEQTGNESHTGSSQAVHTETSVNASARLVTRYWLSKHSVFDPQEPPLREGRMALTMPIKLSPQYYGQRSSGMFDQHKDPSVYPLAALVITGILQLPQAGDYLLVVKPTPPREVGGAGNVQVSIELRIGGELVYRMPYSKSLASRQQQLSLPGGAQPVELRILARSPGFGPSPTGAEVYVGLQAEGEISPAPINTYLHQATSD